MPIQSINPATGDVVRTFLPLEESVLRARIGQAADAFAQHRAVPLEHRALCMRKAATLLEEDKAEFASTLVTEIGTPIRIAENEVDLCIQTCRWYAEQAARILAPELLPSDSGQAYLQYAPIGVVLAIMPLQSPMVQALRFVVPALMGGNVCLLRSEPAASGIALSLEALMRRAGFLRGALTALLIPNRDLETVLGDDRIAAVTVTGTGSLGRAIAAQAGWLVKKSALHLGGSDACIVMPSADIESAITSVTTALAAGTGGARRVIVHADIYNDFLHRFVAAVDKLRVGDPAKLDTEVGPLPTLDAITLLEEQVKAAVAAGGRVATGGAKLARPGSFFAATVLTDVPRETAVYRDEMAGPIAMLFRARDLADAIAIANDSPFGEAASIFTNEPAEQQTLITALDTGAVSLNAIAPLDPRLPFGGTRRSGYGREFGSAGMREFLSVKTVFIS